MATFSTFTILTAGPYKPILILRMEAHDQKMIPIRWEFGVKVANVVSAFYRIKDLCRICEEEDYVLEI